MGLKGQVFGTWSKVLLLVLPLTNTTATTATYCYYCYCCYCCYCCYYYCYYCYYCYCYYYYLHSSLALFLSKYYFFFFGCGGEQKKEELTWTPAPNMILSPAPLVVRGLFCGKFSLHNFYFPRVETFLSGSIDIELGFINVRWEASY